MFTLPRLHQAVIANDLQAVRQFADEVESVDSYGFNALEIAKLLGRDECIKFLQPNLQTKTFLVGLRNYNRLLSLQSKQFPATFGVTYRSHLHVKSYDKLTELLRNCPLILRTPLGKENQFLGEKFKRQLWDGANVKFVISWVNDQIGYGLFADEDLPSGAYIGEYCGFVRRLSRFHHDENSFCLHYPTIFWSFEYFVVDALNEGNELRFMNHSSEPNVEPFSAVDRRLLHQIFLTSKPVSKGEQLLFDYGSDFWRKRRAVERMKERMKDE